jgi:hypothetical protein
LAQFLSDKVFHHIPADSLQAVKLNFISGFKRGDLPLKRWTVMKTQATKIGQSALKITRDSEIVIVKDARKVVREDLTEEELLLWGTPSFLNYLSKRAVVKKAAKPIVKPKGPSAAEDEQGAAVSRKPGVFKVDLKRKMMQANKNRPVEKGIKITIGSGPVAF